MTGVVEQLLSMGLRAAGTASFAWEAKGPYIAAGLDVVEGVMDLVFGVTRTVDPMQHFATRQDLQNAVSTLEQDLSSFNFKRDFHHNLDLVETMQESFQETFANLAANKGFGAKAALIDGSNALAGKIALDQKHKAWMKYYNELCDPVYGKSSAIKILMTDLADTTRPTFLQTLSLYCTTVGLYANYCQLLMMVNFSSLTLALKDAGVSGKGTAPAGKSILPTNFLDMTDYPEASEMDEKLGAGIAVLEPIVTKLSKAYKAYDTAIQKRTADFSVVKSSGGWYWKDTATGNSSKQYFPTQQAATWAMEAPLGAASTAILGPLQQQNAPEMAAISEDAFKKYQAMLSDWKKTRQDYADRCADKAKAVAAAKTANKQGSGKGNAS